MTLFAPANIPAVRLSPEVGGCGKTHEKAKKDDRLSVSCPPCEALIKQYHTGWGASPDSAARTEAEERQVEQDERDANQLFRAAGASLGLAVAEKAEEIKRGRKAV